MPIHDWTWVDAGLFHDFHLDGTYDISWVAFPAAFKRLFELPKDG